MCMWMAGTFFQCSFWFIECVGGTGDSVFLLSFQAMLMLLVGGQHLNGKKLENYTVAAMWGMDCRGARTEAKRQTCELKIETELITTKIRWLEGEKQLVDPTSDGVLCVMLLKLHEFRFSLSSALDSLHLCSIGWDGYNFPVMEKRTFPFLLWCVFYPWCVCCIQTLLSPLFWPLHHRLQWMAADGHPARLEAHTNFTMVKGS